MKKINHEDAIVRNDRQIRTKPYAWRNEESAMDGARIRDGKTKMEDLF